jgi:hypothetical protein
MKVCHRIDVFTQDSSVYKEGAGIYYSCYISNNVLSHLIVARRLLVSILASCGSDE